MHFALTMLSRSACIVLVKESNGLVGTLPFELGELTEMRRLALQRGGLQSSIPTELASLSKLLVLDIDYNELTGELPIDLFESWLDMKEFDLNNNRLSGTISSRIGNMETLKFIQLDNNQFTGTIPTQLGELKELVFMSLANLELNGMMPSQVCSNRGNPTDPTDGILAVLIADCATPNPKVFCECCSGCGV
eukprot:scaffold2238_cov192-Alexandrium_tamarense.AAC.8